MAVKQTRRKAGFLLRNCTFEFLIVIENTPILMHLRENPMSNLIKFGKDKKPDAQELLRREQIAAQIVAIMQAHFSRPGPEEMKEILRCADGQITALALSQPRPF